MKIMTPATKISAMTFPGVSVLLLQMLSILHISVQTNANVFSFVPICEAGCHCFGSEGNCPSYPTITENTIPMYRALSHSNPMDIQCDPFQSSACVSTLEQGEACVVDLIAPIATAESSCPSGYSYRLTTVASLDNAIAAGQYITHTGACGTCSSLQDLALMIEYPNIPYLAQQCFFQSTALKYVEKAVTCYQEIGFTQMCSTTLAYHQKNIVDKRCGYQCAAWGYDGDLGKPSCQDVSGCGACVDELGISARLELVAGRTFANSGYPSEKGQVCSDIASVDVIGGSDVCNEAPLAQSPTEVPLFSPASSISPVISKTESPMTEPVQPPTVAPLPAATVAPTGTPMAPPTELTKSPTDGVTVAPVETTVFPVSAQSFQQCLSTAAIEVRVGALSGGSGVFCDCSEAETGETNRPKCFSSPDRNDNSPCAIIYETCESDEACCGNGVRSCRSGLCRASGRKVDRNRFRLSGTLGGAARNDRNDRSSSTFSNEISGRERRLRGRGRR